MAAIHLNSMLEYQGHRISETKKQPPYHGPPGGAQPHSLHRRPAEVPTTVGTTLTILHDGEGPPSAAEAGSGRGPHHLYPLFIKFPG